MDSISSPYLTGTGPSGLGLVGGGLAGPGRGEFGGAGGGPLHEVAWGRGSLDRPRREPCPTAVKCEYSSTISGVPAPWIMTCGWPLTIDIGFDEVRYNGVVVVHGVVESKGIVIMKLIEYSRSSD